MSFFSPAPQPDASPPFVLWLKQEDLTPDGHFRPAAVIEVAPALRTSGLLRELPGEELKTLLLVFTFVTPNGHCLPTLPQLADGLRLPSGKMQARLKRLQEYSWQGEPLMHRAEQESGLSVYAPSPHLIATRQAPLPVVEGYQEPVYTAAGREAVIAHSRAAYARPRAEVEREIALLNGWPLPETAEPPTLREAELSPEREQYHLKQRLVRLGVSNEQADFLLAGYTVEEIQRQVDWLPYRNAKRPAGFLVAAIEGNYEEPPLLRRRRTLESALTEPSGPATVDETETPDQSAFDLPEAVSLSLPAQMSDERDEAGSNTDRPS